MNFLVVPKKKLFEEFPPVSSKEWEEAISKSLKGREVESLNWDTDEGFEINPFYRKNNTSETVSSQLVTQNSEQSEERTIKIETEKEKITAQLLQCLLEGKEQMKKGAKAEEIQFTFPLGQSFFIEVSKLKAFRILWAKLTEIPAHILCYITSELQENEGQQFIQNTTKALSAIIGGADNISFHPVNEFTDRVNQNIVRIAQHESFLYQVTNSTSGSYYIEAITEKLIKKVWENFARERDTN
ncbi:MAG: hypothetical protein COA57_02275 [Flavobacteriales bacterium]|nr:MAG: hypothetical protein COA57_02275 [Flavobacteriales bacterium]